MIWSQLGMILLHLGFERITVATAHSSLRKEGQCICVRTMEMHKQVEIKKKVFQLLFSNRFGPE